MVQIGSKNQKSPKFQLGKVQNKGGVFGNQKSPMFQRVPKTNKIMTHFHLMRNHPHPPPLIPTEKVEFDSRNLPSTISTFSSHRKTTLHADNFTGRPPQRKTTSVGSEFQRKMT